MELESEDVSQTFKFLGCSVRIRQDKRKVLISLNNPNMHSISENGMQSIFRFPHFDSPTSLTIKQSVVCTMLYNANTSSNTLAGLKTSCIELFTEFRSLGYPRKFMTKAVRAVHRKLKRRIWLDIIKLVKDD
jgi:hypothetical protein